MSNDSDSEIECWDGLKPSASISQPVTNVPIDNAVYKAGVGPASRPIKSSPDFSRKRKRSGVSSSAQGSLFFQKSLPGRRLGDAVIDLTDNNIHVDFAIRQDSTGGNNNHVDKAKKRESPRMNSINVETLKRVKPRKSASQSFSEKRNVLLMSVRNSLIDLTDDRDASPAKSQPPFPLASAQEPTDALYSDPINFQPQSDASSEETTANMDLQAEDGEDSSRSSWSAVSVGIKKSGSLAKNTTDRSKKRILFEDEDSDSCCLSVATQKTISHSSDEKISDEVLSEDEDSDSCLPSVATQNTASYSRGEKISQREVQAIRRPCVDNNPTVTVSPVLNDTSASSVIVRHEEGAVVPSQSNECRDKMGLIRVTTAVAKRVMPRKGSQRTTPLAEIDIDTDSETDSSLSSVMSSQPNACHDNTGDKIHAPAAVAERVTSRNGSQTTTPLAEIEIDTDWDTDVSQESETEGDEEAGIVTSICRAMGEKGYPIRYFSVYGGDDDILYDFRVFIEDSGIPNAGLGAFLTYMGARKLNANSETYKVCEDLLSDCYYREAMTMSPLIAAMPDGRTKGVLLTGDNLHGNYNCVYWPGRPPARPLSMETNSKTINVKIVGECLEIFQELKDRPKDGIGHLGMYSEGDYEHVSGIPCKQNFCIELDAPYAPLGPSDRKISTLFDIKSFLFNNEPAGWAFDVDEKMIGQNQVCDITDDTTGEPHAYARKEVPMYVNEVGHSGLKENVLIRQAHNRITKYFVKLKEPMKPGETVELLTNYGKQYEDVRKRKGYGLKNIHRGDKSDDDIGARLKRNFVLRSIIEKMCMELSLPDLNRILDYVSNQIWAPLCGIVSDACSAPDYPNCASRLTTIQCVAFLRLFWFRTIAERRLNQLVTRLEKQSMTDLFCGNLITACANALQKIRFPGGVSLAGLLDQLETKENLTVTLRRVSDAITQELTEEFYYDLRERIRHPFCTEMWCPVGIRVLSDLGRGYANLKLKAFEKSQSVDGSELETLFIAVATSSSIRMETAEISEFCFSSGTSCNRLSFNLLQRIFDDDKVEKSAALIDNNDKIPKALHALAYKWLSAKRIFNGGEDVIVPSNKKFLLFCGAETVGSLKSFVAEVASLEINQENAVLNRTYYKVWQIAYVIMTCARHHLEETSSDRIEDEVSEVLDIKRTLIACACRKQMTKDKTTAAYLLYREAKTSAEELYQSRVKSAREHQRCTHNLKQSTKRSKSERHSKASRPRSKKRPEKKQKSRSSTLNAPQGKGRPPAMLIYDGPPQTKLEHSGRSMPWPGGWTQRTFQRQTGDSKGQTDYYFYSPQLKIKIRSKADVFRFLAKLEECGGDESKIRHKSA